MTLVILAGRPVFTEPPRDLIKAIPNVGIMEMEHNREKAHCCAVF